MRGGVIYVTFCLLLLLPGKRVWGQKNVYDSMLVCCVKVENPVYKPVVGLAGGAFSFVGDVRQGKWTPFTNEPGMRLTVSTFLDKKHFYVMDFHFLMGGLNGRVDLLGQPLNFRTELSILGVSVKYAFAHLYRRPTAVCPYISAGVETFHFNSKGDLKNAQGEYYRYASDGTIRDALGRITTRDYVYETDLRSLDLYGRGSYPEYGFGIPLELGVEAFLAKRVSVRLGMALHLTTTDMIDNVDEHSTGVPVDRHNDFFTYSFFSIHLDLFSDPEYQKEKTLFAEIVPPDDILSADEDQDWVLDLWDECPYTPAGVEVDSLGCPLDTDGDGVPDYMDLEAGTPPGTIVDDSGRTWRDTSLQVLLNEPAAPAGDIGYYLGGGKRPLHPRSSNIPLRFRQADSNHDGEISFDELLKMIDDYFDYKTLLSMQDIYDLINFFFSQ